MVQESEKQSYLEALGRRVKHLRLSRGLTQVELATRTDIDERQIQRIEAGKTNTTILTTYTLCQVFGISMAELFTFQIDEFQ